VVLQVLKVPVLVWAVYALSMVLVELGTKIRMSNSATGAGFGIALLVALFKFVARNPHQEQKLPE
jgi:membrane associated rhomboid family serine protease